MQLEVSALSDPLRIRPYELKEPLPSFNCGNTDLNEFLETEESDHFQRKRLGKTYLGWSADELVGYVTLAPTSLSRAAYTGEEMETAGHLRDKLHDVPSLLIARLALQKEYMRSGIGTRIVDYIIAMAFEQELPFRFIVVDAKESAKEFYDKNGFVRSEHSNMEGRDQQLMMYLLPALEED